MDNLILNSLEVRNFRTFRDLKIEHLGRVNLLVGKNNVGKTSLLEAIRLYASRASTPETLFIAIDWSVTETRDGTLHTRPLEPGEDYTADNLAPRFTIQTAGATLSYPIDPSLPQGILRLNSNEIPCVFTSANGLSAQRLTELWDSIALTKLEIDVLTALRLIAPGVADLNFVSTPLSGRERIPVVRLVDNDEPLPLYSLGDGMLRALGISLALVNVKDGMLLIDEFENGIHYTALPDLWRLIFRV